MNKCLTHPTVILLKAYSLFCWQQYKVGRDDLAHFFIR